MIREEKSFIGVAIFLAVVGIISIGLYFRQLKESGSVKASNIPIEIGKWKGEDVPLEEKVYAILETKNVIVRKYTEPDGTQVVLYIACSDINRRVSHPPEVCYTGGGDMILDKEIVDMADFKVNSFVSSKDNIKSLVYYWYKAGDRFTTNYVSQQVNAVLNQLKGNKSTIALVRVSTQMMNYDKEKAGRVLQEFSAQIIPLVRKYLP